MKVWKSPVFYFGILLVLAVLGLLAAPFVIDWNGYRPRLEAYGQKLTGRTVSIDGPVSATLFPWPRLTAERVSIANPPGFTEQDFATARRITIRMTLAGLLQGSLDVESIDVEAPVVNVERLVSGEGNWAFSPSADLIRSDILSRVKLDQIKLTAGTVNFHDGRRGETVALEGVNAEVASPGVQGPWRLRSQALYNGRGLNIVFNTGSYVAGQPLLFGVKLAPADHSGYVYSFDGSYKGGLSEGEVRIAPAMTEGGKTDAEGEVRPLIFTAQAKGNFDRFDLTDIQMARQDVDQSAAIATGSAAVEIGKHISVTADLSASMLDLDELAGAKARNILRESGSLAVVDSVLSMLPADTSLAARFGVTALKSGGETLNNVSLDIEADHEQLRIKRLSAGLPGNSDILFKGNYFPGAGRGELSGDLAVETGDLREMVLWLWQEARQGLSGLWSGSRGRLKMQTDVSLTASELRLINTDFELDGERGKGSLTVNAAGRGAVDVDVQGGRFDLDSYAPQGIPAFSAAARQGVGGIISFALPRPDAPDLRLKFKADELLLNAVTAREVAIDLQSGANGLDLRALSIGSVGGANMQGTGLILDSGKGPSGSIGLDVKAEDPGELLKLLGLASGDGLPSWALGLGPTALRADVGVKPVEQGSEAMLRLDGTAGALTVSGTGRSAPGETLSGSFKVSAPNSARILSIFGLSALAPDAEPGSLELEAQGTLADGFNAIATLQAYGGRLDYQGKANPAAAGFGLDGKLALRTADAAPLIAATGIPVSAADAGALVLDAPVVWQDGKWTAQSIEGRLGSSSFSGAASLTPGLEADARITTGPLTLADVLGASLLDWSGGAPDVERSFAPALPFGLTGQIWITPSELGVHPHFTARNAEVGIAAKAGDIQIAVMGKDDKGRDAQIEISSAGTDASRKLAGLIRIPVDLAGQLALASGAPVAEGSGTVELRFESEGRSPGAALAAMQGKGSYQFSDFRLLGISPAGFSSQLSQAKDAAGISTAFEALRSGEGLAFGEISGDITVSGGEAVFAPVTHQDGDADIEVKTVAELASGQIDIEAGLQLKARDGLPRMSVSYAGPPMALVRSEDSTELSTSLGVTIMQQGIDELERLQEEQRQLAKQEEQQRAEDEARLQAYYAQRDELLLRKRELKVQAEMQVQEADRLRRQIEAERAANTEINKAETRQRLRELRVWRRMAKLSEAPDEADKADAAPRPAEQPVKAATPVPTPAPKPVRKPKPVGPVILAKPPGAPVIISPEPQSSPTQ